MKIVILLTFYVGSGLAVLTDCPDRWLAFEGSCYWFGFNNRTNFFNAQKLCQSLGANLVQVENELENAFIQQEAKDRKLDSYWLGLTDYVTEGTWIWYPSNQSATFFDWSPGEPNSYNNTEEDCASSYVLSGYKWADYGCNGRLEPICEIRRGATSDLVG